MSFTSSNQPDWPAGRIHPLLRDGKAKRRAVFVRLLAYFSGIVVLSQIAMDLLTDGRFVP